MRYNSVCMQLCLNVSKYTETRLTDACDNHLREEEKKN